MVNYILLFGGVNKLLTGVDQRDWTYTHAYTRVHILRGSDG